MDDRSKEVLSKNISSFFCASRSHHSPSRKLGNSQARSLPLPSAFENLLSLLPRNVIANRDFRFQEWKLSSKAEIFLGR